MKIIKESKYTSNPSAGKEYYLTVEADQGEALEQVLEFCKQHDAYHATSPRAEAEWYETSYTFHQSARPGQYDYASYEPNVD